MRCIALSLLLATVTLTGCYQRHGESAPVDTVRLQIWASSDLPPRSVRRARIAIADEDRSVALPDDGIPSEPIRLLEVDIAPGEHRLAITLFGSNGVVVATRTQAVRVTTDQSVTVVFAAGCLGVECADSEICVDGACEDECLRFPERCMPCSCATDADCGGRIGECGDTLCLACQCVETRDDALCPPPAFCGDDFTCRGDPSPMCACGSDAECGGPLAGTCFFEVCDCSCFAGPGLCEAGTVCSPGEAVCRAPEFPLDLFVLGRVDRPDALRRYRVFIGGVLYFTGDVRPSELGEGLTFAGTQLPAQEYDVRVELLDSSYLPIAERTSFVVLDTPTRLRIELF